MAAQSILIDTSVIIDFLRKKEKQKALLWEIRAAHRCHLSVIALFELFAGATSEEKRSDVEKIATWIEPIELGADIAIKAAALYRELNARNRNIEFRDLFIAATAMHHGLILATLNTKHFQRVKGLMLFRPA